MVRLWQEILIGIDKSRTGGVTYKDEAIRRINHSKSGGDVGTRSHHGTDCIHVWRRPTGAQLLEWHQLQSRVHL